MKKQNRSHRTKNVHGHAHTRAWEFSHHIVPPITASTTFRLDSLKRGAHGFQLFANNDALRKALDSNEPIWIYDRLEEPSSKMLEEQLADMESGEVAVSFSSGMGAISGALLSILKSGDQILAHHTLYGCTYSLITSWLPRFNIGHRLSCINPLSAADLKDQSIKVIYFESVSNPNLEIIDINRVVKLVNAENKSRRAENKIKIIVDNTFATPWALRPLEYGVDMVIQSLTKNIGGFGTEMGGAIVTYRKYLSNLLLIRKDIGANMHPHSAWNIMVYGVSSQVIRFEAQQKNAVKIAKFLESHKKVERVIYPGLKSFPQLSLAKKLLRSPDGEFSPGVMLSFILKGENSKTEKFINHIAKNSYSITLAVSLGLTKTLIEVPGLMTHAAIPKEKQEESGIPAKLIRMSIGIEQAEDLMSDLSEALDIL